MNLRNDERGLAQSAGGNRFAFASLVRKRADEITHGASPQAYAESSNSVSVAIAETAAGEISPHRQPPATVRDREPTTEIVCRDCGKKASIRRKPGVAPQGRPPTRCVEHGLSPNWQQISYV